MSTFEFGKNIIQDLEDKLQSGSYLVQSARGTLVAHDRMPVAGIELREPLGEYLEFISSLPEDEKPNLAYIIPRSEGKIGIIVNAPVVLKDDATYINGRKVRLL